MRIFVYTAPADIRCQFDGLSALVSHAMGHDVSTGDYFVFFNRRRTQCKILCWEPGGFSLFARRLERGTFERPSLESGQLSLEIDGVTLTMILAGIEVSSIKRRRRYQHPGSKSAQSGEPRKKQSA